MRNLWANRKQIPPRPARFPGEIRGKMGWPLTVLVAYL